MRFINAVINSPYKCGIEAQNISGYKNGIQIRFILSLSGCKVGLYI